MLLYAALSTVLLLLLLGLFTSVWLWQVKDWGVSIDWDGRLLSVDSASRAAQTGAQSGDYISFSDAQRLKRLSGQSPVGTLVNLQVSHSGQFRVVTLEARDSSLLRRVDLGIITWVGMGFVLLGIAPLIARRRDFTLWLFFLATEVTGLFLITVKPRGLHLFWAEAIAYSTLSVFPAVLFHFHTLFPQRKLGRLRRPLVISVYACAAVILPINTSMGLWNYSAYASDTWVIVIQAYLASCLLACLGMLIHTYRTTRERRVRSQLRIITFCSGIGLAANTALMLPALLVNMDVSNMMENFVVVAALTTPFGYAYAILRYNLLIEGVTWRRWLVRAATSGTVCLGALLTAFALQGNNQFRGDIALDFGIIIAVSAVCTGILDALLGEWAEKHLVKSPGYVELIDLGTRELEHCHKLDEYGSFFTEALPAWLKSRGAMLFLSQQENQELQLVACSPRLGRSESRIQPLPLASELSRVMRAERAVLPLTALNSPVAGVFPVVDTAFLSALRETHVELLLPLVSSHQSRLIGFVALAVKETDEEYTASEQAALTALARTASTAAENVLLFETQERQLAELRDERESRAALARYAISAQEEARRQIARDLHDRPLQELGVLMRTLTAVRDTIQVATAECEDKAIILESANGNVPSGVRAELLSVLAAMQVRLEGLLGENSRVQASGTAQARPGLGDDRFAEFESPRLRAGPQLKD